MKGESRMIKHEGDCRRLESNQERSKPCSDYWPARGTFPGPAPAPNQLNLGTLYSVNLTLTPHVGHLSSEGLMAMLLNGYPDITNHISRLDCGLMQSRTKGIVDDLNRIRRGPSHARIIGQHEVRSQGPRPRPTN